MLFAKTRFSVFHSGSKEWVASQSYSTEKEYTDYLFSESRLNKRINILSDLSLPILEAISKNYDFIHIIQYSKELPEKYKEMLYALSKKYSFIRLLLVSDKSRGCKSVILEELVKRKSVRYFSQFNLDDDDLLSLNFAKNAMKYVNQNHVGHYISLGRGVTGFYDNTTNLISNVRDVIFPKINIGLMAVCEFKLESKTLVVPPHGSHMEVEKYAPIMIDCKEVCYFWMRTLGQDTGLKKGTSEDEFNKINRDLDSFSMCRDTQDIKKIFPSVDFLTDNKDTYLILDKPCDLNDTLREFKLPFSYKGNINIEYELMGDENVINNNALISFKFKEDSFLMDPLNCNLSKSGNDKIGYYRYLKTLPGLTKATISIDLPGVLESISFRRFKNDANISLLSLKVLLEK